MWLLGGLEASTVVAERLPTSVAEGFAWLPMAPAGSLVVTGLLWLLAYSGDNWPRVPLVEMAGVVAASVPPFRFDPLAWLRSWRVMVPEKLWSDSLEWPGLPALAAAP
jgi:hypothetical protein